jgi:hypothetical protein
MAIIAMIHLGVSTEDNNELSYRFPTPVVLDEEEESAEPEPKEAEGADDGGDDEAGPQNAYTDDESDGVDEAVEGEGEGGGEPAVPECTGPTCYMQGVHYEHRHHAIDSSCRYISVGNARNSIADVVVLFPFWGSGLAPQDSGREHDSASERRGGAWREQGDHTDGG